MPREPRIPWPEERTKALLAYHAEGLRPRAISGLLGVTRNAVIGKLNRCLHRYPSRPRVYPSNPAYRPQEIHKSLFETWEQRKARRLKERANAAR